MITLGERHTPSSFSALLFPRASRITCLRVSWGTDSSGSFACSRFIEEWLQQGQVERTGESRNGEMEQSNYDMSYKNLCRSQEALRRDDPSQLSWVKQWDKSLTGTMTQSWILSRPGERAWLWGMQLLLNRGNVWKGIQLWAWPREWVSAKVLKGRYRQHTIALNHLAL